MTELRDYLPPKLREIADVIGDPAAIKLSDSWPGLRLFVPATMTLEHPIALAIGIVAAEKLARRYASETITVPKAEAWRRKLRDARLVEDYTKGDSGRELAQRYGLHENYVYQLIARLDAQRQPDLFGEGG